MQRIRRKEPAVEGASRGGYEATVGSNALLPVEVGVELGQRHEHIVEVVAREIVQHHPQLGQREANLTTRVVNIVYYLRDDHQSVRP